MPLEKKSRRIKHVDKGRLVDLMEAIHGSRIDTEVPQEWLSFPPNAARCRQRLGVLGWEYVDSDTYGAPLFISDAIEELGLELKSWTDNNDG